VIADSRRKLLFIHDSRFTNDKAVCIHFPLDSMGVAHRYILSPLQGLLPRGRKFDQRYNQFPEGLFIHDSRFTFHE
jgi:hypothetical protein